MPVTRPDSAALDRVLDLLATRPENPDVANGYLDLLDSTEDQGTGRIQALWQSAGGSGLYDAMIRLGTAVGTRMPGRGGKLLRAIFTVPDRLRLSGGEQVLDVGSGPGNLTRWIAAAVGDSGLVVGLDVSTTMLRRAVREDNPPNLVYTLADANHPPFADGRFDAVSSSLCLHLLPDPFAAIDEMHRMLRPGGRIALAAPGAANGITTRFTDLVSRAGQIRLFERGELSAALRRSGFDEIVDRSSITMRIVDARKPD